MAALSPDFKKILGQLQQYLTVRDILSVAVMASLAEKVEELDEALMEPLTGKPFKVDESLTVKLSALELPVARAKFRFVWRQCQKVLQSSSPTKPAAPDANGSTHGKSAQELPAGYWRGQILKYKSVTILEARSVAFHKNCYWEQRR